MGASLNTDVTKLTFGLEIPQEKQPRNEKEKVKIQGITERRTKGE